MQMISIPFLHVLILSAMLTSCITTRTSIDESWRSGNEMELFLYYASLAGSSHNSQPWQAVIAGDSLVYIYPDRSRQLHVVDPLARGLYLSLGAFVENFRLAAASRAWQSDIGFHQDDSLQITYVSIKLKKSVPQFTHLSRLEKRMTLRTPFAQRNISEADVQGLLGDDADHLVFYSSGSYEGNYIKNKTLEAYTHQSNDEAAKDELARWIRFSNGDVKKKRDGLTTSGMGIKGIAGFVVSRMFKPEDAKKQSFVNKGIEKTKAQVENCGGWLLFTGVEDSPEAWIRTGMIYERVNLKCRDLMIGFHPMNQMIEERFFEEHAYGFLPVEGRIHFVARIGYVDHYPDPVSVRRPVSEWAKKPEPII
jgi:hypothetical protein